MSLRIDCRNSLNRVDVFCQRSSSRTKQGTFAVLHAETISGRARVAFVTMTNKSASRGCVCKTVISLVAVHFDRAWMNRARTWRRPATAVARYTETNSVSPAAVSSCISEYPRSRRSFSLSDLRIIIALLKSLDAGRRWKIEWPEFVNVVGQ